MFKKNFSRKKTKVEGLYKRPDDLPIKKISREELNEALKEYYARGGTVTKITEADIQSRTAAAINFFNYDESTEFLNGD